MRGSQDNFSIYGNQTYVSPDDFSVTYDAPSQVSIRNLGFIPTTEQLLVIEAFPVSGPEKVYTRGSHNFAYTDLTTSGVITVNGAAFTNTDTFRVTLLGPDKVSYVGSCNTNSIVDYSDGSMTITRLSDTALEFSGMADVPTTANQFIYLAGTTVSGGKTTTVHTRETLPYINWVPSPDGGVLSTVGAVWPEIITDCQWKLSPRFSDLLLNAFRMYEVDPPDRDLDTNYQVSIDAVHAHIHSGSHYTTHIYDADVDIAAPKLIAITTPDSAVEAHSTIETVFGGSGGTADLYEGATINVSGTVVVPVNNDRNSLNTATVAVYDDATFTVSGTRIWGSGVGTSGGAVKMGGEIGTRYEFILKRNTVYRVVTTVAANDTPVRFNLYHYEEQ